jgi:hypothetical protein
MIGDACLSALGHKRTNRSEPKSTFVRCCPKADKRGAVELSAKAKSRHDECVRDVRSH